MGTLIAGIDELVGEDLSGLADRDTIVELHRQLARLEAVATRAAGAFDARRGGTRVRVSQPAGIEIEAATP